MVETVRSTRGRWYYRFAVVLVQSCALYDDKGPPIKKVLMLTFPSSKFTNKVNFAPSN